MSGHDMDELTERLRREYNPPPRVPREEMWAVIQAGIDEAGPPVRSLDEERRRRAAVPWRNLGWAAAAVAVLGLGVGIGRMTAPAPGTGPVAATPEAGEGSLVRRVAVEHLGRTEALLSLVRADGRDGRVDPAMGEWSRSLLAQTRLLLDSSEGDDPAMRELLEDLELVLMQIGTVAEAGGDEDRARSELSLALSGLEEREVLSRIQAVLPQGPALAGT